MAVKILQINFQFNVPREAYEQTVAPMASDFAAVPGCCWKIWLMNEAHHDAGGIYLKPVRKTRSAWGCRASRLLSERQRSELRRERIR